MKRRIQAERDWQLGCLMDMDAMQVTTAPVKKWTVWRFNMFMLPQTTEDWEKTIRHEYDSVEELVADGWLID